MRVSHVITRLIVGGAQENTIATVQSPTVGEATWSPAVDYNAGAAGIYVPSEFGVSDDGVVVQGIFNQAEWVVGTVDLAHLRKVRQTGEMRNSQDWTLQPGAPMASVTVEKVCLRSPDNATSVATSP